MESRFNIANRAASRTAPQSQAEAVVHVLGKAASPLDPPSLSSTLAQTPFALSFMKAWHAGQRPFSTRKPYAGSAAKWRRPAAWPKTLSKKPWAHCAASALYATPCALKRCMCSPPLLPEKRQWPQLYRRGRKHLPRENRCAHGQARSQTLCLGIVSGIYKPDGIVGDLGGGSLELIEVNDRKVGAGVSLPLGGLALQDASAKSLKKAEKIVRDALESTGLLQDGSGRTFYAVGGTWRSLARLHMWQRGYPLHVMHGYTINAKEAQEFTKLIARADPETLSRIEVVNDARRPLLAYGALVLENIVRLMKPSEIVISALGVREGHLYELLDNDVKKQDPLLSAARELNQLRSRSPRHGEELIHWSDQFAASIDLDETEAEKRLRHAACLLADIGWRAHPDYRGEQSLNIIAHAAFVGIDHPGRAFLALAVYFRHVGLVDDDLSPRLRELASSRMIERARLLGAAMRAAYLVSAAMPGILPRTPLKVSKEKLLLTLPKDLADLNGDRLMSRLKQLAKLLGKEAKIEINNFQSPARGHPSWPVQFRRA